MSDDLYKLEEASKGIEKEITNSKITAGKNFKDHFLRHKKLLENVTGKKYSKLKKDGPEFLADISKLIDNGTFKYIGKGTLKKGEEICNIYRGEGLTLVVKENG